ncbi:STAS domain-containing protein [Streptomyces wuyuanensis]|uniref:STAS domain-containing protein n=1 Tax=Streptomyces wuyuanensis TaxID=1196353 RepID=UPI00378F6A9D
MNTAYRWEASGARGRVLCLLDGPDEQGTSWVAVCGDIDHRNVATLAQALTATVNAGSRTTLLDLCNVGFVDSTVLHALLEAQRSLRAARARLLLASPLSREVERLLDITGARTYFTFTDDAPAHKHCRP